MMSIEQLKITALDIFYSTYLIFLLLKTGISSSKNQYKKNLSDSSFGPIVDNQLK